MRSVNIILFFVVFSGLKIFAQSPLSLEFLKDTTPKGKEYIRLIFKADSLFKSRQFQNAIDIYEKAQALKPKEVYPRFKAEDIRTLYLPNEIVKNDVKEVQPQEYRFSKKHREKIEKEQAKQLEKEGKKPEIKKDPIIVADNKKNEIKKEVIEEKKEVKKNVAEVKVETEIKETKKEEQKKEEKKTTIVDEKTKQDANSQLKAIEDLKANEEAEEKRRIEFTEMRKKEEEAQAKEEIEIRIKQSEAKRMEEKKDKPVETNVKKEKEITTISDVIIKKSQDEEIKRIQAEVSINTETRPEEEEALLKAKYPNEKTVETIKEKTKTTTQVVINKNGKIIVYSKVEHNWGSTFYFLKEPGQPIVNISRDYFERNTKDK